MVAPSNFDQWFATHIKLSIRWVLQEQFSGSGRISLTAHQQQLPVLFPVDLRYGWDLRLQDHRNKLSLVQQKLKPLTKFSSPDCRLWAAMTNTRPKSEVNTDRKTELPMLEWLHCDNCQQAKLGLGYINEMGSVHKFGHRRRCGKLRDTWQQNDSYRWLRIRAHRRSG